MKTNFLILILICFGLFSCSDDNLTNNEEQYPSIKIGKQVWMLKNLDVDHYRNGDSIIQITAMEKWGNQTDGVWCYYDNNQAMGAIYGKLYNWYAVTDPRGLAPEGWHIATHEEWEELTEYLGGDSVAGAKLKEAGAEHWYPSNEGATNESGISALPDGGMTAMGTFFDINKGNYIWTISDFSIPRAWGRTIEGNNIGVSKYYYLKRNGFSVRCVKD